MSKVKLSLKKMAVGVGLVAAVGYVAGLLTAPQSGKETREDIKNTTKSGVQEAEKQLRNLHSTLDELLDEIKERGSNLSGRASKDLEDFVEKAKNAKQKAREVLSAIHEGDAEDKDLAKAIDEANIAIKHLRDYLKK